MNDGPIRAIEIEDIGVYSIDRDGQFALLIVAAGHEMVFALKADDSMRVILGLLHRARADYARTGGPKKAMQRQATLLPVLEFDEIGFAVLDDHQTVAMHLRFGALRLAVNLPVQSIDAVVRDLNQAAQILRTAPHRPQ